MLFLACTIFNRSDLIIFTENNLNSVMKGCIRLCQILIRKNKYFLGESFGEEFNPSHFKICFRIISSQFEKRSESPFATRLFKKFWKRKWKYVFFLVRSLLLLSIISHKINTFGPTVFQLVYPIMEVTFCKDCKILL